MDNPAPSRSQSCRISDSRPVLSPPGRRMVTFTPILRYEPVMVTTTNPEIQTSHGHNHSQLITLTAPVPARRPVQVIFVVETILTGPTKGEYKGSDNTFPLSGQILKRPMRKKHERKHALIYHHPPPQHQQGSKKDEDQWGECSASMLRPCQEKHRSQQRCQTQ